jgi:hypothetical protein
LEEVVNMEVSWVVSRRALDPANNLDPSITSAVGQVDVAVDIARYLIPILSRYGYDASGRAEHLWPLFSGKK